MSKACTICEHANRAAIEAALIAGTSLRVTAGRFGTTKSALDRHKGHMPEFAKEMSAVATRDAVPTAARGHPQDFQPGDARINRKGRAKQVKGFGARLRQVVGDDADELVTWGLKIVRGELSIDQLEHSRDGSDPELISVGPSIRERLYAWRFLVEHHSGKAPQTINLNAMGGAEPVYDWARLTDEELEQVEQLLQKASVTAGKPASVEVIAVASAIATAE